MEKVIAWLFASFSPHKSPALLLIEKEAGGSYPARSGTRL